MSGVIKRTSGNDDVFEAVDANLAGGTLVIPSATATESGLKGMKAATDAALNVLGVCANDCITAANRDALVTGDGPAPMSLPGVDFTIPDATSTVYSELTCKVQYTAAAVAYGTPIVAAAGGLVRAYNGAADDAAAIVGKARDDVPAAGGWFRAKIDV